MKILLAYSEPCALVANRDFKLPDDGWMQLLRYGQIRGVVENSKGKEVPITQIIDRDGAKRVVASFRAKSAVPNFGGALVDFDHFSMDPSKESRAAAWIDELQDRDDGIYFKGRFSTSGKAALEGGDYRFISPVLEFEDRDYSPGEKIRPIGLSSAGLTNEPQIKGCKPISNRAGTSAGLAEKQPTPMKALLKLLGLAEDASEESAIAAVQTVKNRATQVEALTTERDALLADAIEGDLERHKAVIKNRDTMKASLVANRKGTLAILESIAVPEETVERPARVTNRGTADTPVRDKNGVVIAKGKEAAQTEMSEATAARVKNRASEIVKQKSVGRRVYSYSSAFDEARAEIETAAGK